MTSLETNSKSPATIMHVLILGGKLLDSHGRKLWRYTGPRNIG